MRRIPVIGISTWVYFWRPLAEVLSDIAKAGYGCVEIWAEGTHLDPRISPDLSVFRVLLECLHLRVQSLHAPFKGLDIASLNEGKRENSLELIRQSMEFCSEIEGKIVVIHPCSNETSGDDQSCIRARNKAVESLDTLATFARKLGIKLAVENLPNMGAWRFATELSQLSNIVSEINNSSLGLCLDTGHVLVGREDIDFSKNTLECGKNLFALHIQDTDGKDDRHWLPGQGVINWTQFLKDLVSIDYNGVLMLEVTGKNTQDILPRGIKSVRTF